jgi:hypothetical protein
MMEEELNSRLSSSVEPIQSEVKAKELKNFGSPLRPSYSIRVGIWISVRENPDVLHKIFTKTGIISRETIPFEIVSNFRGSVDRKPFYSALILHGGNMKRYEVMTRDTGGLLRTRINYEPVVLVDPEPEELKLVHPAEFYRLERDIKVLQWELHNYKHYFMLFISSKRYESFDLWVKREKDFTTIKVNLAESELKEKKAPCSWYLKRLSVFKGLNLEEKVRKTVERG